MSSPSKDIQIGSGYIYAYKWNGTMPAAQDIENEDHQIGFVKDGAVLKYTPSYQYVKDIDAKDRFTSLVSEEVYLKFGLITWDADTFNKICQTSNVSNDDEISVGGLDKAVMDKYIIRFVHISGDMKLTILGLSTSGFELGYIPNTETVISAEFRGSYFPDGSLLKINDLRGRAPHSATANPADVLEGKVFFDQLKREFEGAMVDKAGEEVEGTLTIDNGKIIISTDIESGHIDKDTTFSADLPSLGTATADKVISGYTFSSDEEGINIEGTYEVIDLSDTTATANDVLMGKIFHNAEGTAVEGNIMDFRGGNSSGTVSYASNTFSCNPRYSGLVDNTTDIIISGSTFGNATDADVMSGKTFTSSNGLYMIGTASLGTDVSDTTATASDVVSGKKFHLADGSLVTGTIYDSRGAIKSGSASVSGTNLVLKPADNVDQVFNANSGLQTALSNLGNATAADVVSGKTFTSVNGMKITGTGSLGQDVYRDGFNTTGNYELTWPSGYGLCIVPLTGGLTVSNSAFILPNIEGTINEITIFKYTQSTASSYTRTVVGNFSYNQSARKIIFTLRNSTTGFVYLVFVKGTIDPR